jgi:hypothetical protein
MLRPQHNLAQKKKKGKHRESKKKKRKESNVKMVGSTKTMMIHDRCALRRISTTLLARQASHTKQHLQEGMRR